MHKFNHSCVTPYSVDDVLAIVMDIESYPEFLPWCHGARIIDDSEGVIVADLVISFKGISETYRSEVRVSRSDLEAKVEVAAISGPFKTLNNCWTITKTEAGCNIEFELEFELGVGFLSKILSPLFAKACDRMLDAFEKRAQSKLG